MDVFCCSWEVGNSQEELQCRGEAAEDNRLWEAGVWEINLREQPLSSNVNNSSCHLLCTQSVLCYATPLCVTCFIYEYLWNACYAPGTVLDSGATVLKENRHFHGALGGVGSQAAG